MSDFSNYRDAFRYLVSRLGPYCSYCERWLAAQLAVEHIQPKKGAFGHPNLVGRWENFLLACVNCNSTKGDKQVVLANLLLPDRDNTSVAFVFSADGKVGPAPGLTKPLDDIARDTLALTGLDKRISVALDENGRQVAIDRVSQRLETWAWAEAAKVDVDADPGNRALKRATVRTALARGFFSIWMTVFDSDADMRIRLIEAFAGTGDSGCFDPVTTRPVSPASNPDGLTDGGKI